MVRKVGNVIVRTNDADTRDLRHRSEKIVRPLPNGLSPKLLQDLIGTKSLTLSSGEDNGEGFHRSSGLFLVLAIEPPLPSTSAKIIFPRSVWITWVTTTSTVSPMWDLPFSTTTIVPSSR